MHTTRKRPRMTDAFSANRAADGLLKKTDTAKFLRNTDKNACFGQNTDEIQLQLTKKPLLKHFDAISYDFCQSD